MKRDMKLVFDILQFIESTVTDCGPTRLEILQELCTKRGVWDNSDAEDVLVQEIMYQLQILEIGGFVAKEEVEPFGDQSDETYYQLSWSGHDQLDAMRKVISIG
ncbi:DUF2513 domain-containing protein [Pseudomonas sp. NMI760_13]|uniref:DUF2513 domain-containing protein n=1 Tax=Pseudomonas sp. NMI760_13 TaxID=2903147 RepID=UPI001E510A8D|nr:DUF2513 domain-containing protein [Pseudomonas sp. NMI760_13]MCE0914711.1 DUF2513 domain-containing protein [Pseudomonas sp. NMI760_13]